MVRYETTFEYGRLKNHDGLAFERASGLAAFLAAVSLMSSCSVGSRLSSTGKPPSSVNSVSPSYGVSEGEDSIRLQSLWNIRSSEDIDTNFPIGPGDVIEVNAQYMTELEGKKVRVAGDGTVDLPLIGVIHAAGLSEEALSALIVEKLRKYIYKPEVEV